MKNINSILFLFLLFACSEISAQGATIYAGTSTARNQNETFTPEGTKHSGYHIGMDAKLGDDGFAIVAGAQYNSFGYVASDKFSFSHEQKLNMIKGRLGITFRVFKMGDFVDFNWKALGSIDYLLSHPEEHSEPAKFNEGTMGVVLGPEFKFKFLSLSFEYEKGFFRGFNMIDNSSFNYFNTSLGFSF